MFKLIVAATILTVASCAPQYYNPYQPYVPYRTYTAAPVIRVTPSPFVPVTAAPILPIAPVHHVPSAESQAPILRQEQNVAEDGSYQYGYQTGNGISAQESGGLRAIGNTAGTVAQGSYSYTSPEGKQVSISYVADENGFHAVGDAIPTAPPVPAAIARALAYIAAHPQQPEQRYIQKYY